MILAYITRTRNDQDYMELSIVPDKPDQLSIPVNVFTIHPTRAAVYRVSAEESFMAIADPTDGGLVLKAIEPAGLYLTLNVAIRPGLRVKRIKLLRREDGSCTTMYEKERGGWEEYVANHERT